MISLVKQIIHAWSLEKNQRIKMQQAYLTLVVLLAFIAGMITLINISLGRTIIMLGALVAVVYIVNAVAWTVFDMIVARKIEQWTRQAQSKKR